MVSLLKQNEVTSAMTSTTSSNDVGAIKTTNLWVQKTNGDSLRYAANLDISVCIHSPGDCSRF